MGERKGTNKYYPPDYDPKKGGLNSFMGVHALRERARKLHLGILIIRFEMPYNIWCEGCNNHIGMGVRYNAEKTKLGMYYSTPVYQFRMKCHLCDNHFEIKTDPGNLDYVIVSGARRQENRWDPTENGQVVPDDKRVIRQLADDAMFKLQHGVEDQSKLQAVTPTLGKLEELQDRWRDDYSSNKALRDSFRIKKKEMKAAEEKDKEFLKKRSLDIPLLAESEDDAKIASLIRLQPSQSSEERQKIKRLEIDRKSNFPFPLPPQQTIESDNVPLLSSSNSLKEEINQSSTIQDHGRLQLLKKEKQRSSLGITFRKRESAEKNEIVSKRHASASDFNSSPLDSSKTNECNTINERLDPSSVAVFSKTSINESTESETSQSQHQRSISNLLNGEKTCKAIISSTLHNGKLENREIRDSSNQSSVMVAKPSASIVSTGLSIISCDYDSSTSSNEDEIE